MAISSKIPFVGQSLVGEKTKKRGQGMGGIALP
jgi:hypothetical protein